MANNDLIQISFKVPPLPSFRNKLGQFTAEGSASRERNKRLAIVLQGQVVQQMRNHIAFGGRAQVSTNRLVRTTATAGNVKFDNFGLGVGVPEFLDKSISKYWRTFEEGSLAVWKHPFTGTKIRGRFGGSIIGYAPTRTPGPQPQPLAGGPWDAHGGKLRWVWSMPEFTVTHEIQPAYIYRAVFQENQGQLREQGVQSAIRILQGVFDRGLNPPSSGFYTRK